MYEPMAVLRSLAELQSKFQGGAVQSIAAPQVPQQLLNYEEALAKALDAPLDVDIKTPIFLAEENQAKIITYKGEQVAAFYVNGVEMICLPQVYDIFLKSMVGGLHTIYTKLKRLDIHPLVCNVEQVRALRSLGAIQPGVNRCKLIARTDFDQLFDDCSASNNRPGRPLKRTAEETWLAQSALAKQRALLSPCSSSTLTHDSPINSNLLLPGVNASGAFVPVSASGGGGVPTASPAHSALLNHFIFMQQVFNQNNVKRENVERKDRNAATVHDNIRDNSLESNTSSTSASRGDSKSTSPGNSNTRSYESNGSSVMSNIHVNKLTALLEMNIDLMAKRDELRDERERREQTEKMLIVERRRNDRLIFRVHRMKGEIRDLRAEVINLSERMRSS